MMSVHQQCVHATVTLFSVQKKRENISSLYNAQFFWASFLANTPAIST